MEKGEDVQPGASSQKILSSGKESRHAARTEALPIVNQTVVAVLSSHDDTNSLSAGSLYTDGARLRARVELAKGCADDSVLPTTDKNNNNDDQSGWNKVCDYTYTNYANPFSNPSPPDRGKTMIDQQQTDRNSVTIESELCTVIKNETLNNVNRRAATNQTDFVQHNQNGNNHSNSKSAAKIIHPILKQSKPNNYTRFPDDAKIDLHVLNGDDNDQYISSIPPHPSTKNQFSVSFSLPNTIGTVSNKLSSSSKGMSINSHTTYKKNECIVGGTLNDEAALETNMEPSESSSLNVELEGTLKKKVINCKIKTESKTDCRTKTKSSIKFALPLSPPSLSGSDLSEYEAVIKDAQLAVEKIDKVMKPPITVEEGGRYSILNPNFTPKFQEESAWMMEIKSMQNEIIIERQKCISEVMQKTSRNCGSVLQERQGKKQTARPHYTLKELDKVDGEDEDSSSEESTDTLLEEARLYVAIAKEKIVTLDDWQKIDENKKLYKKKVKNR